MHNESGKAEKIAFWIALAVGAVLVIGGIELIRWLIW